MDLKSAFLHKIPNRFQIIDIWIPLGYVNLSSAVKIKGGMTYEKDYNN